MPGKPETKPLGELAYRLTFSSRRRTVGLMVTATGEVVVRAPRGMSPSAVAQIVDQHRAWIEKKLAEKRAAWEQLRPGKWYYRGQALDLRVTALAPAEIAVQDGLLLVRPTLTPEALAARLEIWYSREALRLISAPVKHFAPRMELAVPPLEVRDWRRRWGECHPDRTLRFNWRLVLLPPEILDYVVVHELAHLIVPGHPPPFWQEVGKYLPDYAPRRRWLKQYGGPFLLWRPARP